MDYFYIAWISFFVGYWCGRKFAGQTAKKKEDKIVYLPAPKVPTVWRERTMN